MRKLLVLSGLAVFLFVACGNSQANSNKEEKNDGNKSAQPAELSAVADQVALNVPASNGGTKLLVKSDFLKTVWNYETSPQEWKFLGDKPAIIDFYADWCGPCKIAAPILEEISQEFAGKIDVYKIDTEREKELAAVFGIRGIPAFLYIPKDGRPVMTSGIARSKEDTKKMFVENINKILLSTN
jgi:thioredoxin